MAVQRTIYKPSGMTLDQHVAELNARIESAHERLACPTCGAPVGERCVRMSAHHPGWADADEATRRTLKHSHRARWTQETPAR